MTEFTYTQIGDYLLPNLTIGESQPTYGKYGMLRKRYLKESRRGTYAFLLISGKLNQHLAKINRLVRETASQLVKERAKRQGVDETMKAHKQIAWVGAMNMIKAQAEGSCHWSIYCWIYSDERVEAAFFVPRCKAFVVESNITSSFYD